MQRVTSCCYYWSAKDVPDILSNKKTYCCYASGLVYEGEDTLVERNKPENYKSITIKIDGFRPWIYLEVPKRLLNNNVDLEKFISAKTYPETPFKMEWKRKSVLLDRKRCIDLLKITCSSEECVRKIRNAFRPFSTEKRKVLTIGGIDYDCSDFAVHEDKIDFLVKNSIANDINFTDYFSLPKKKLRKNGFSTSYYSAEIDISELKKEPEPSMPYMASFCVIDFEQYSKHHDSTFPDAKDPRNFIFQIGMLYGYFGRENTYKKILVTLFDPEDIEGVEIIRCQNEKLLFMTFAKILKTLDPCVLVHYNGLNYDLNCEVIRNDQCGIAETQRKAYSKIIGEKAEEVKVRWSSKAYGDNNYSFIDGGWVQLDVKVEIERNYKLDSYSLKKVAEKFLKDERKTDLSARQMFMLVKINMDWLEKAKKMVEDYGDEIIPKKERMIIKKEIVKTFPQRYGNSVTKKVRGDLLSWDTAKQFLKSLRESIKLIGEYCLQDCLVTIKLCDNRNIWEGFLQLSNVTKVPISYLQGKGTLVKVGAMIYHKCYEMDIVINTFPIKEKVNYQGAYVVPGTPDYYLNVIVFDFFSLYPTNIILGCLDYTNHIQEKIETDPNKHIKFEWESHENCIHGQKKVVKQKKTICGKFCHIFERVLFDDKGMPINEGVLPSLLRAGLDARVQIKNEMAVYEIALRAHEGKLENPEKDLAFLKNNCEKYGVVYVDKPGSLSKELVRKYKSRATSLNARQLAVKVFLNSVYGGTGAQNGPFASVGIASSITYMARIMINYAIKKALEICRERGINIFLVYGDTDSCMLSVPDLTPNDAIKLGLELSELLTHYVKLYMMGLDENYMVQDASGKKWSIIAEKLGGFPRSKISELKEIERQNVLFYDYIRTLLNFEKAYLKFLFLTKKRYIAEMCNTKGVIIERTKKGCVLTRRDNPKWTRDRYSKLTDMIMNGESKDEIFYKCYGMVNSLFTDTHIASGLPGKIYIEDFIIYMGIKNMIDYAKKVAGKFVDEKGNEFNPILNSNGDKDPNDPRLVYTNLPQVAFIKKLRERGQIVPSGTRIEYLFIEKPEGTVNAEKLEDYTFFKERRLELGMKIDYVHYLQTQFVKPITELLSIRYRGVMIPYEDREEKFDRFYKNCKAKVSQEYEKLKKYYLKYKKLEKPKREWNSEKFKKYIEAKENLWLYSGSEKTLQKSNMKKLERSRMILAKLEPPRLWNPYLDFEDMEEILCGEKEAAKITIMEEKFLKWVAVSRCKNEFQIHSCDEVDEDTDQVKSTGIYQCEYLIDPEFLKMTLQNISIHVINSLCKKHRVKKYSSYDHNMHRTAIAMGKRVMTTLKIKHVPVGTIGVIINKVVNPNDKSDVSFTVEFEKQGILEGVSRNQITMIRYQDENFMHDILEYRIIHRKTVEKLRELFEENTENPLDALKKRELDRLKKLK